MHPPKKTYNTQEKLSYHTSTPLKLLVYLVCSDVFLRAYLVTTIKTTVSDELLRVFSSMLLTECHAIPLVTRCFFIFSISVYSSLLILLRSIPSSISSSHRPPPVLSSTATTLHCLFLPDLFLVTVSVTN